MSTVSWFPDIPAPQQGLNDWFSDTSAGQAVNSLQGTAQQYQKDLNDWFYGTSVGQGINSLQSTAQDWFNQTPVGQGINQMHDTYGQRFDKMRQDEQLRNAQRLTEIYNRAFQQQPSFFK